MLTACTKQPHGSLNDGRTAARCGQPSPTAAAPLPRTPAAAAHRPPTSRAARWCRGRRGRPPGANGSRGQGAGGKGASGQREGRAHQGSRRAGTSGWTHAHAGLPAGVHGYPPTTSNRQPASQPAHRHVRVGQRVAKLGVLLSRHALDAQACRGQRDRGAEGQCDTLRGPISSEGLELAAGSRAANRRLRRLHSATKVA